MIPVISASKVAGLIGLHKFQDASEIKYELLCRYPETKTKIQAIEQAENRKSRQKILNDVLKDEAIRNCVFSGLRACKYTTDVPRVLKDVEKKAATILSFRGNEYTQETKEWLASEIRGAVSKRRGLDNENHILNNYETERDVKVTERNTKTITKDYGLFKITGRTDGYVESENRIVDSKDRTRKWNEVPLYDEIQLRCYMNMTGASESELIERFPDGTTRHTKFMNDPEKWATIQLALEEAVVELRKAMEEEETLKWIVFQNTEEVLYNGNQSTAKLAL
jgi:hypothetical protein